MSYNFHAAADKATRKDSFEYKLITINSLEKRQFSRCSAASAKTSIFGSEVGLSMVSLGRTTLAAAREANNGTCEAETILQRVIGI